MDETVKEHFVFREFLVREPSEFRASNSIDPGERKSSRKGSDLGSLKGDLGGNGR